MPVPRIHWHVSHWARPGGSEPRLGHQGFQVRVFRGRRGHWHAATGTRRAAAGPKGAASDGGSPGPGRPGPGSADGRAAEAEAYYVPLAVTSRTLSLAP